MDVDFLLDNRDQDKLLSMQTVSGYQKSRVGDKFIPKVSD